MKNSIIIYFTLLSMTAFSQSKQNNVTIYQDGKEFEVKGDTIPINLKNKKFSIRFYVEEEKGSMISFFADKDAFLKVGSEKEGELHCFAYGTAGALRYPGDIPDTYNMSKEGMYGYIKHYDLYQQLLKLPSQDKNLVRKEFAIASLEGETMKNNFLENVYFVLYPKSGDAIIDKKLMTKVSLRFPNFKQKKTYPEDHIDLENFNFKTFKPEEFYKGAIANKRAYRDTLITARGGMQYDQGNLDLLNEGEDRTLLFVYRKPITLGNTIKLNQLSFSNLEVLTTNKGEVIAIATRQKAYNYVELLPFVEYLNLKLGNARTIKNNLEWRDGNKIIQLAVRPMKGFDKKGLVQLILTRPKTAKKLKNWSSLPFRTFEYQPDIATLNSAEHLAKGKVLFRTKTCTACHLEDGGGSVGPNLTDNKWILGGGEKNIYNTIYYGGRPGKGMISWGKSTLTDEEIKLLTNYIISLQGTSPKNPKEAEGDLVWPKK